MAKTSVGFAGQLRGPALDGGEGGALAGAEVFEVVFGGCFLSFLDERSATLFVTSAKNVATVFFSSSLT